MTNLFELTEEPPVTVGRDLQDIKSVYIGECHTQGVERCVQLVSGAAKKVMGSKRRHQVILTTIDSRKRLKRLESKQDFMQLVRAHNGA